MLISLQCMKLFVIIGLQLRERGSWYSHSLTTKHLGTQRVLKNKCSHTECDPSVENFEALVKIVDFSSNSFTS